MVGVLVRRLVTLVVTLLAASFLIYGAVYAAPGDPIAFLTGGRKVDPVTLAALRSQYHLDDPFLTRYWAWLSAVVHGDLGTSVISGAPVGSLLGEPTRVTGWLVGLAALLTVLIGVVLGVVAALRKGVVDDVISLATTFGLAVPGFVMAIALMTVFSVRLNWFSVFGAGQGVVDRIWHLVLPATALACSAIALVTRFTRESLREELTREHVETAYSRGVPHRTVIRRHVLRNGMIPITAATGVTIAGLVAGSVVIERAFNLNGLGSLLVKSVAAHDFPVVQAVVLLFVTTFVVLNFAIDFLYTVIDPRLKGANAR